VRLNVIRRSRIETIPQAHDRPLDGVVDPPA
jgi:hypothetical protein